MWENSRRDFLKVTSLVGLGTTFNHLPLSAKTKKMNVIFIAIDDLNDWIGCFGGNPQVKTPHMDKLAYKNGGMVMYKNYCAAAVCCPSRAATMWGILPSKSGVYGNANNPGKSPVLKDKLTLPQYFSKHGYFSTSMGKIFHKHGKGKGDALDEGEWAFDKWYPTSGGGKGPAGSKPYNQLPLIGNEKSKKKAFAFDWGMMEAKDEETKDYKTGLWAADVLKEDHKKPFFMAVGISRPHLPWYVPKKYFDMYPLKDVKVPEFHLDDLDDILTPEGKKKFAPSNDFLRVQKAGKFKEATQAYLASVSYADACVGVVLDQLNKSKYKDNTSVVIWGDHGWFLGEKLKYRKTHLWEESARCPLIVKVPAMTKSKSKCMRVTNLIDLYPTLIELCGLPAKKDLDGRSFLPLLKDHKKEWPFPTLTAFGHGRTSVRDERYAYMNYGDGTEEFYDHNKDPMEYKNQVKNPEYKKIKEKLKKYIPKKYQNEIPKDEGGKAKDDQRKNTEDKNKIRAEIKRLRVIKDKEKDKDKKGEVIKQINILRKSLK
jgi:arylsulfatase A-like enzyme